MATASIRRIFALAAATTATLLGLAGTAQAQLSSPPPPMMATESAVREREEAPVAAQPAPETEAEIDKNSGLLLETPEGERAVRAVTPDLVLVLQGDAALRAGDFSSALGRYEQALAVLKERHPARVDVLLRIGLARSLLGDCPGALAVVRGTSDRLATDPAKAGERRTAYADVLAQCRAR